MTLQIVSRGDLGVLTLMEDDTERPVIKSAWKQVERGHGGYTAGDDYFYPCIFKQGLESSKHFNIGLLRVR